ncbi:hypothetical protein MR781_05875 [bacterium]|nr:hypothetical protein [bacterium]MDY2885880.1 hypothetical protein [Bariatricus sp.]MDY4195539.1 hypothetical protein [Bariatricus sp.]
MKNGVGKDPQITSNWSQPIIMELFRWLAPWFCQDVPEKAMKMRKQQ